MLYKRAITNRPYRFVRFMHKRVRRNNENYD